MIEVQHLTKRYGRVTAVDDVSFRVERGEILGFLGPNGAGKTTTMRILTGYMPATEGQSHCRRVRRLRAADRSEAPHRLSAGDAAALPRHERCRVSHVRGEDQGRPERRAPARIKAVMERTRIADMADRLCAKLSKGYRQRVGLAQALIPQPRRADPRRADRRPRPQADHRNARAHQGAGRRSHDHPQHAHPAGSLADLPARRHHQQGQGRRGRHAGQPDGAAARIGNDVRAGGRRAARTRRSRSPACPA